MEKNLNVYITSRGRWTQDQLYTLKNLYPLVSEGIKINVVVPYDEYDKYYNYTKMLPQVNLIRRPESVVNLAQSIEYIIYHLAPHNSVAVIVDDDLRFCVRKDPSGPGLRPCEDSDVIELFKRLRALFNDENIAMAGVSARGGNNQKYPSTLAYCTRQMQLHAIDVDRFKQLNIRPSDVVCKSDFHMTLSVLEHGYKNAVIDDYALDNARGSNSSGGVSSYRTLEVSNAAAHRLKELHPNFVKIVEKPNQWKNMSGAQLDVQMSWKKAYAYGLTQRKY